MGEKRRLSADEAIKRGMTEIVDEQMPNGEQRYRRMNRDGSGYIRTETQVGGWQNAHVHKGIIELYAVQSGWLALATWNSDRSSLKIKIFRAGEYFSTQPGVPHNIYLPKEAVIHTVKFGQTDYPRDWIEDQALDSLSKQFKEEHMLMLELTTRGV